MLTMVGVTPPATLQNVARGNLRCRRPGRKSVQHHLGGFRQEMPVSRLHILDFFSLGRFSRRGKTAILGGV
jgi:hypothetical protein